MADNIKGINVVIGADTTQLSAALSDVNKKSKSLQSELKDVERLLKFEPGNADLIAQKQQILTDSIANTSEKLNQLRSVQQQVNQQFANGDISPEQFRAFNREVTRTEQQLQSLTDSMNALNANRITVTINGDTRSIDQALQDINKRSKDLQGELRQVDQLLRLDPTNLELVAQKQRLLSEQIENSSDKLRILRDSQQQVNQQFANGEISAEQYRNFQREIIRTEQDINGFRQQLRNLNGDVDDAGDNATTAAEQFKKMGETLSKTGDKIKGVGTALTVGLTAPITAFGLASLKVANDFDSASGKIKAALGLTAEEAQKLKEVAKTLYNDGFGEGLEEVNDALITTSTNIQGLNAQDLSTLTKKAFILKDVFDAEINESTRTASVLMKNFKISGSDAMDLVTVGFQKGGNFSDELLDSLREYAPQFRKMGFSADEALGILLKGAEKGAFNLDKVGDAIKEFNIRIKDGSKNTTLAMDLLFAPDDIQDYVQALTTGGSKTKEYAELVKLSTKEVTDKMVDNFKKGGADAAKAYETLSGILGGADDILVGLTDGSVQGRDAMVAVIQKLREIEDPTEQAQLAVSLFGTQWEDLESDVVLALDSGIGSIDKFKGATNQAGKDMYDNFGHRLTEMFRDLKSSLEPLGLAMLKIAEDILPSVKAGIGAFSDVLANMSPETTKLVLTLGGIAAVIGPIILVIGSLVSAIGSIATGISVVLPLLPTIGAALGTAFTVATGPIGIAVAAIIGAAVLIIANWKPISKFFVDLWKTVSDFTISAWEGIKEFFANLVTGIQSTWEATPGFFSGLWDGITSTLTDAWQGVLDFFAGLWEKIKGFFSSGPGEVVAMSAPMIGLPLIIFNHWDELVAMLQGVWDSIASAVSTAWTAIVGFITGIVTPFIPLIVEQFNNIKNGISQVWEGLKNYFVGAWEVLRNIFLGALLILVDLVTGDFGRLKEDIAKIWDNIKAGFSKSWSGIQQVFTSAMQLVQSVVKTGFELMSKIIGTVFETIKKLATDGWNGLKTVTISIVTAIGEAIKTGFQASAQFMASIFTTIKSTAVSAWNGLKSGISTAVTATGEAIKTAFNAVLNFFKTLPTTLRTLGVNMFVSMKNGIVATIKTIQSAAKTGIDAAFKFIKDLPSSALQWGKDIIQGLINGIKNKLAEVQKVVGDVAETIKSKIRGALSIKSPSRVTMKYGENVSEGLAIGIKNKSKDVANASNDVAKTVDSSFSKAMDKIVKNAANAAAGSKTSADKIKKSFAEAFSTAQSEKKLGHLDTSEYIQALQQIQSQYAKTSDQSRKVTQEIAAQHKNLSKEQIEAAKKSYDETKAFIDKRSENGTLSLVKELDMWEKVQGRYKEGSEQRKAAEEELGNTRVQIYEKLSTASENFLAKTKEVNDNVAAEELRLNKAYEDAVTQRAASINDFAGLFDAVTDKSEMTGQELLENLKGQVDYLRTWSEQIAQLATKGIDEGLLAELRELGPKALPQLLALNQLTTDQLSQYSSLWLEKSAESREIAVGEFTGLREDTNAQIVKLHTDAAKEMNGLKKEFLASVKEISSGSKKEFDAMNASLSQIGKQSMQGLLNGLKSMKGEVVAQAKDIANAVSKTMQKALDIHSPSREMAWIGEMAGQGLVNGMASMVSNVKSQASHLATAAMPLINQTDVASASSTSSTNTAPVFNMEGLFAGANFNVRSDQDIKAIAKELFDLTQQASRGMGGAR
ncbi:phage-related minor tail protein [Paenibacillus sp. SORGH_AS306]|uniref:phage tail tape measure protein n=1 Tax=unclassified Paenibacillus TaxID=185978 RepID=UPI00277DBB3A|nr:MULTISPECIES: phage tail tape measure protein [unclassified Paenibacillus]MDQ1233351.1 phage-related minor tail protein [Paenibacillus sp. SORGH_AS_0306]MDR6110392.1 phage-related minor tail protein [Paenibacillus sp. SORGH_AS_0338]